MQDPDAIYSQLLTAIDEAGEVPCHNAPDLFFAEEDAAISANMSNLYAKQLCSMCPVQALCAQYGIAADVEFGVWGGLTPYERRNLKRRPQSARGA